MKIKFLDWLKTVLIVFMVFGVLVLSFATRWPFLFIFRGLDVIVVCVVSVLLIVLLAWIIIKTRDNKRKIASGILVVVLLIAVIIAVYKEIDFHNKKDAILNKDGDELWVLGKHFVVGYDDLGELRQLVDKGAIGGIFITKKNVGDLSKDEIRMNIEQLQTLQASHGRPPLLVTTDQEGGLVSKISPPLTKLPVISSVIVNGEVQRDDLLNYANTHGRELAEIGVNVNFAPVVDINEGLVNSDDQHTKIYSRAISNDPELISEVATEYCNELEKFGVICTLKHFPGLGHVENDTHITSARLDISVSELEEREFVPFRNVLGKTSAILMLSHVVLTSVDAENPASVSKKVVQDLIRGELNFNGVLITDDFTMGAISGGSERVEGAALNALNAGVDIILISYDHELYYYVMDAMLKANAEGLIDDAVLEMSDQRLDELSGRL